MAYWTDIFTLETWAQARLRGFSVTGFPEPTPGPGGYGPGSFSKVGEGDVLLCYCKKPAARWVGALRVTSPMFISDQPVWGLTAEGRARFPARFHVEPLVTLEPAKGLDGNEAAGKLPCLSKYGSNWWAFLQRSLNSVPDEDGALLLDLLRRDRPASAIDSRQPARPTDGSLLDALATRPDEDQASPEVGGDAAPRVHTEIQGKLRDIGVHEGFDVWVADRGIPYADGLLGEGCLTDLPVVAPERTRVAMRNIDVIWFRSGTGIPDRLYEIENSTTVYSGLLRFNDVMIDYPLERTFIVGGDDRTRRKFEREIQRRTFEKSGLSLVTKYLDYEAIRGLWRSYRSLGSGSSSWG
jgi:type II restriction enzyme